MKKLVFSILFFFSVSIPLVKAQFEYVKPHDIKELIERRVIVVIEQPDDAVCNKLRKKKKNLDAYNAALNEYNKNFGDAVTRFWKISKGDIEFKTLDEVKHISDKKNYIILYCRSAKESELSKSYLALNGILWWSNFKEVARDRDYAEKMTVFGVSLLDKLGTYPIYQSPVPDVFPTRADLDYVISAASNYLTYRDINRHVSAEKIDEQLLKENQPLLKSKILLLRRDQLDKRLTPHEIKKIYPFPYLVTSEDTIARAINEVDPKYAVAIVSPYDLEAGGSGRIQYVQYAFSPAGGLILGTSGLLDMPSAENGNVLNLKPLITKRCLMDFCMYIKPPKTASSSLRR